MLNIERCDENDYKKTRSLSSPGSTYQATSQIKIVIQQKEKQGK